MRESRDTQLNLALAKPNPDLKSLEKLREVSSSERKSTMKRIYHLLLCMTVLASCVQFSFSQSNRLLNRKALTKTNKQERKSKVRFINPATLPKTPGYTQVVEVTKSRTIYISGQIALDRSGKIVGTGDFRAQTQQVFENIKAALEAVGATFKDVVKLNIYVVDVSQVPAFREVRDKYVNTKQPPASTLVEVRKLTREELLVEVEAVAVLPE
jgi:reactive intermediate/imine deaminase